jgi:hypothetical protein
LGAGGGAGGGGGGAAIFGGGGFAQEVTPIEAAPSKANINHVRRMRDAAKARRV